MALYVLGDTHFSEGSDKPMDVFGGSWTDYREKLISGLQVLMPEDTLVLCGDFSWGMSLEQALADFKLLCSFPGRKLIVKGNHDFWWGTVSKMHRFLDENGIEDVDFIHNNCFYYKDIRLCGTRGWFLGDVGGEEEKIFKRELMRLEASLKAEEAGKEFKETFCFLHYPPICGGEEISQITDLLKKYRVSQCFYGHLHGQSIKSAFSGIKDGISYRLVSADAVGFKPIQIRQ